MAVFFRSRVDDPAPGPAISVGAMERLLTDRIPTWHRIRGVTHQPSLSIGVIYQGQVIFKHNTGVIDVKTQQAANSDTLYCIASLSKAFMAASLDLLVREQKVS